MICVVQFYLGAWVTWHYMAWSRSVLSENPEFILNSFSSLLLTNTVLEFPKMYWEHSWQKIMFIWTFMWKKKMSSTTPNTNNFICINITYFRFWLPLFYSDPNACIPHYYMMLNNEKIIAAKMFHCRDIHQSVLFILNHWVSTATLL